ncbi:hypothetical protein SAMN05216309_11261 [Nitrosomonas europaea]|nr:hypothetical protein SAMN05216310_13230 [Nitrosomonas europaea]SES98948.1 hypothetical protein SAMN05216309_11261 [Nitrosomonas europaea]SJZ49309.1 hypothetical protein SAMN02745113_01088 [Nitrosomonas europaea]
MRVPLTLSITGRLRSAKKRVKNPVNPKNAKMFDEVGSGMAIPTHFQGIPATLALLESERMTEKLS